MTRLDSAIRRLTAQRDLLDWAAGDIDSSGLILELGLGNGRTYDHLRDRLPGREIYVFERAPAAHPNSTPPDRYLIVGDIFETLPLFVERFGHRTAALIHVDIGTGDEEHNADLARRVSPLIEPLLRPGGLLLGDRGFVLPNCAEIRPDASMAKGRYFVYRRRPERAVEALGASYRPLKTGTRFSKNAARASRESSLAKHASARAAGPSDLGRDPPSGPARPATWRGRGR